MASARSGGLWQRPGVFGVYELLQSWWRHRVSFLLGVGITLAAVALYYFTFLGERPTRSSRFSSGWRPTRSTRASGTGRQARLRSIRAS